MSISQEQVLQRLADIIESRKLANGGDPDKSYVARLFSKGDDAILKKIGEEATETVMAAKDARVSGDHSKVLYECADLWFHSLIMLAQFEISPQAVLDEQKEAVAQLMAIGINPKEGMLKYMSPKRLREFYLLLDGPKKHIFCKAPKIANALAMKLLEECSAPCLMSVALPWGAKKGNNQSAMIRLKVVDPPYDPSNRGPRAGQLRLVIETEAAGTKTVTITGISANTGPDNVIGVLAGLDGQILLSTTDEPQRWKWVLALNAGLHRTAAIRCMMDQAAAVMPWHPSANVVEQEPE